MKLKRIGSFDSPTYVAAAPGVNGVFVVQRGGVIRLVQGKHRRTFLDVSSMVSTNGERGLLSVAFAPDYASSRLLLHLLHEQRRRHRDRRAPRRSRRTGTPPRAPCGSCWWFRITAQATTTAASSSSGRTASSTRERATGAARAIRNDNAQNPGSMLGKLLRINPASGATTIYSSGLRNPYRFSFDLTTDPGHPRIAIGDVGQDRFEEIDYLALAAANGANFGWNDFEGFAPFAGAHPPTATGTVKPIKVYSHSGGACAIVGGYVVRDRRLRSLRHRYVYGDFCTGKIRSLIPRLGGARKDRSTGVRVPDLSSFGEGAQWRALRHLAGRTGVPVRAQALNNLRASPAGDPDAVLTQPTPDRNRDRCPGRDRGRHRRDRRRVRPPEALGPKFIKVDRLARLKEPVYLTQPPGPARSSTSSSSRGRSGCSPRTDSSLGPFLKISDLVKQSGGGRRRRHDLDRLSARLRPLRPVLRRLYRPRGQVGGGALQPQRREPAGGRPRLGSGGAHDPGVEAQAPRRLHHLRAGRLPATSARETGRRPAIPAGSRRTPLSSAARSCGSIQPRRGAPRSGRPGSATPAGSPSIAPPTRSAIADVGDQRYEEIEYLPIDKARGANFGWPAYDGFVVLRGGLPRERPTFPAIAFPRRRGCAVIGGYLVRDPRLTRIRGRELNGSYLYGVRCSGKLFAFRPRPGRRAGQAAQLPVQVPLPDLARCGQQRPRLRADPRRDHTGTASRRWGPSSGSSRSEGA